MLIEGASLHTCHRESQRSILLLLLNGFDFGKVEGGEAGIEMELQLDAVAGLAIGQSGKLLGVSKQEFNLKAQHVEFVNFRWLLLHIGREQHDKPGLVSIAVVEYIGQSNRALERDMKHHSRVQVYIGLDVFHERQPFLSSQLDLAIVLTSSATRFLYACVEQRKLASQRNLLITCN